MTTVFTNHPAHSNDSPQTRLSEQKGKPQRSRPQLEIEKKRVQGLHITPRDIQILRQVAKYRFLTSHQIRTLVFNPDAFQKLIGKETTPDNLHKDRCWDRLKKLSTEAGMLDRYEMPSRLSEGRKPFLYVISPMGLNYLMYHELIEDGEIELESNRDPSNIFLAHTLTINTVRIAIELAATLNGWEITRWIDEKQLKREYSKEKVIVHGAQGQLIKTAVIPDAFFTISTGERLYNFILEVDRASETTQYASFSNRDFASKIRAYMALFTPGSGGNSQYETVYGVEGNLGRVLTVTTGPRRAQHLKSLCEGLGGRNRFWFTHLQAVDPATFFAEKIWQVASRFEPQSIFERSNG